MSSTLPERARALQARAPEGPQNRRPITFLREFLRRPREIGSVIPSSRFLEERLVEVSRAAGARLIVEFGPGTGGTTRALLRAMPTEARLLAVELNPHFAAHLESFTDPRLLVHQGSALDLREALAQHGLAAPDVVISGIPFSTMPQDIGRAILHAVWSALPSGGRFVAYQFRDAVGVLGRDLLGAPEVSLALLNVPPMRVYCWRKRQGGEAS